jgi:hypothetical protein
MSPWPKLAPWAQTNLLEPFAREIQQREGRIESGYFLTGLSVVAALALGVWLLARLLERCDGRRPTDSRWMLFVRLCGAHGLRWRERWLLWRIAREQRLDEPAWLFLDPRRLEAAAGGPFQGRSASQLEALRRRLFAGIDAPAG